jgi:(2R)-ethylmalonyl-CoA mutase
MQQIMAFETDLLEHGDIFDGSEVITNKVEALKSAARDELAVIEKMGGAVAAVESGYMKGELVKSNSERIKAIEDGRETVVGVNAYETTEPSPLSTGDGDAILTVPEHVEQDQIEQLKAWRKQRDDAAVKAALDSLRQAAIDGENIMEPSIACAKAGVTTGEWGQTLRDVFGQYRAPTGVGTVVQLSGEDSEAVRKQVEALSARLGVPVRFLVGKPGLDGHSNGAEQIAVRAGEVGMEVIYEGIRLTPEEIVSAAIEEQVHVVGLSILSGSHVPLVREVMSRMREAGLDKVPVVVGGIIPDEDARVLKQMGVARVYTPKDFRMTGMMGEIVSLVERRMDDAAA